jgi:hypothetical protein
MPVHDSLAVIQRHISAVREPFNNKLEMILSQLEKMAQKARQPSKKY